MLHHGKQHWFAHFDHIGEIRETCSNVIFNNCTKADHAQEAFEN